MKIETKQIKVIQAEKENEAHRKGFWVVRNENSDYNLINSELIPFESHCKWWETVFEKECLYCIIYKSEFCGYIRLSKEESQNKEKYEISIAIAKNFQNKGVGSYSYKVFEELMSKTGIREIIALTHLENKAGKRLFEKNGFKKTIIKNGFIRYYKKI